MTKSNYSMGFIIILAGIAILLGKFGVFSFLGSLLWPVFILAPAVMLHILYFGRTLPAGVLIPSGILITYSLLFFYCNIFGWASMSYLWPGFIFGVAVGLYEFYLFDYRNPKGVLIAAIILGVLSGIFFGFTLLFTGAVYFIALALISLGVIIIIRKPSAW